ncbi:acetate--CoA ligase family protein [Candidatus Pacearchaeota archaeon]|nr:acetate--CoA ligase family protein [Candidatus Pacearchaeota archaeon]
MDGEKKERRVIYNEYKAERFLSKYVKIAKGRLVRKLEEIDLNKFKFPFFLKIISNQAVHKSDVKGVRLVSGRDDLEREFRDLEEIARRRRLRLDGFLVQEEIEGEQLIIGIKKDHVFGHVILLGLGGIFTEVLKDIAVRKCPVREGDAQEMIDELKAKDVFYGARGKKLNLNLLKKNLAKLSEIPLKNKNIAEMDINPFILNEKEGKVVDARIVFDRV